MTDRYRHLLAGHEAEAARLLDDYLARAGTAARSGNSTRRLCRHDEAPKRQQDHDRHRGAGHDAPTSLPDLEDRLVAASNDLTAFLREKPERVTAATQARIGQHAIDCAAASAILRAEHQAATRAMIEADPERDTVLLVRVGAGGVGDPQAERLAVAFKSVFFYIRACQDDLYGLLLLALTGSRHGQPSMNRAVKNPLNPVAVLLSSELPGYLDWFANWRDQRNNIKNGCNFGIVGPNVDLGIVFSQVTAPNASHISFQGGRVIKLAHIAQALDYSGHLTRLARSWPAPRR